MPKAILVIDVPTLDDGRHLCNECPVWNKEHLFCEYDFNMKVNGCSLKPMPNKRVPDGSETDQIYGCYVGWNACIDEILGETE